MLKKPRQKQSAQPPCDGRPCPGAAPFILLRDGLTEEEIAQPFVGVATCWNEAAPCNIALNRQAQAVKLGVKAAHGTPREIHHHHRDRRYRNGPRGHALLLASREAIADTVELTMRGHCYDAIVGLRAAINRCPA